MSYVKLPAAKNLKADGNGNRSKYYINGMSFFRYCREKGFGKKEYKRCMWLINNKCMTPEEALNYHRVAREDKAWIKKVNQRRRNGIRKEYLELPDECLKQMGYDKITKYFYKGYRLTQYCKRRKINYGKVQKRITKFGLKIEEALKLTKKELMALPLNKKTPRYGVKQNDFR